jgi:hypothetical protein
MFARWFVVRYPCAGNWIRYLLVEGYEFVEGNGLEEYGTTLRLQQGGNMEVSRIIAEIDAQISKLQQARELLAGTTSKAAKGPGRPKGSRNAKAASPAGTTRKRKLSPEGRKRIADAMKRRWAERRKQAAKSSSASK